MRIARFIGIDGCESSSWRQGADQEEDFFMGKMILGYKPNQFTAPDIFKYDISHYAKFTYVYLQRHFTVEGEVAPSKKEIAYYIDCSKRKVDDAIKELEEVGLIQIIRRKKGPKENDTNLYIIYHPEQIEGIKLLPPYEEIKYKKKKQKPNAGDALPKNLMQEMHYPEKPNAGDALPLEDRRNNTDSNKNLVQEMHGTRLLDLDREIDSNPIPDDSNLSDEEMIKIAFRKHFKEEISDKQAESFVDVAVEQGLSLEEVIDEMKYIEQKVTIKTTAAATLYSSLSAGGWAKKKQEEAAKKEQKPKRRLVRKKPEKLPEMLRLQMEEQQPPEPVNSEESNERIANIQAKLKQMNEKFAKVGANKGRP